MEFDLDTLYAQSYFSSLDYFFAIAMRDAFGEKEAIVITSCALVSKMVSLGHICLDIERLAGTKCVVSEVTENHIIFPEKELWLNTLRSSSIVSKNPATPLVIDHQKRLYLAKYYDFQLRMSKNILQRMRHPFSGNHEKTVSKYIEAVARKTGFTLDNAQKKAVTAALCRSFVVISGGPGTGKTYVTQIIKKVLCSMMPENTGKLPKVLCLAPTGKAASRMEGGKTIHSVLQPLKNRPGFYHDKKNPILADVVIIDEASMIDMGLMTRLLEAIPLRAKVILLGDKHQLTSVQAGSVFSDICDSPDLSTHICLLERNFRSDDQPGISQLSKSIQRGDTDFLKKILISETYPDVRFFDFKEKNWADLKIEKAILDGYQPFIHCAESVSALNNMDRFTILCAHNSGEYGTSQFNHVCEKILRSSVNSDIQRAPFFRIIMKITNDYQNGLFNGDTGIVFEKDGSEWTCFKNPDNTTMLCRLSELSGTVPAFAMTIHKSQGSEFDEILIILPSKTSPVITRQLLYTGVTRARRKVIIAGDMNIIKSAVGSSAARNSGLVDAIKIAFKRDESR